MGRLRGFIIGNFVCNLFFSACAVGELMVRRDRSTIFEIPRSSKPDNIVPISQDALTEFHPILETADTTKEALWQLQQLLSDQDKAKSTSISARNLDIPGDNFNAPHDAIAASEDLSNINQLERNEHHLRNLIDNEVGTPKNTDPADPVTERYYLTKIYDNPEYYKTTSNGNPLVVAPPPDVVEYVRSNVFVQNGGISLNGDRLKRPQHACGGNNARIPCDSNDVTSSESTPHNDVSIQVALQVLTDLVKERADNRRMLAKQAAEQAHIDRTLDKLWKMG